MGALIVLAGCAATGAPFHAVEGIPSETAVVYIYRPAAFVGGGISYDVHIGDQEIVTLKQGGYFPYIAKPGETEFWARTEARGSASEFLKAGTTYYLKGGVGVGFFVGHPKLQFVDPAQGMAEVSQCKLLQPKSPRGAGER